MIRTASKRIDRSSSVSDIVSANYRTADIFRKYGIEFCCGGGSSLEAVCEAKSLDVYAIKKELEQAARIVWLPNTLNFDEWSIDFLADYIINIHHQYLKKSLPPAKDYLERFAEGHQKKYLYVADLLQTFNDLVREMLSHLTEEEEIIFPYIRQIAHAYYSKESYAALLVRTLRKPVENMIHNEHKTVNKFLDQMRQQTDHYTPPPNACLNHKVTFLKLLEIDNDLVQHLYLENNFLFPKAINMEKELLELKG